MNTNLINEIRVESLREKFLFAGVVFCFVLNMLCPQVVQAKSNIFESGKGVTLAYESAFTSSIDLLVDRFEIYQDQPINQVDLETVRKTVNVVATAYSSDPAQTDSTPCITANGFDVCQNGVENVIAANFLAFGTRVRIPDLYGDKVFTVQDRMHPRFSQRIDLWKISKDRAVNFGKHYVKIEVLE